MKNHSGAMFEMEKLLILWTVNLKKKASTHVHIQTHTNTQRATWHNGDSRKCRSLFEDVIHKQDPWLVSGGFLHFEI